MRVLIVDDEAPARRKIARFLLEHQNITVVAEATGGNDAIARIRADKPDLVFLDVQMPGIDGFGVLEAIAADSHVPHIIFVTAHERYAVRAFDICAIDYLLKPFDQERFDRAMARIPETVDISLQLRMLLDNMRGEKPFASRLLVSAEGRSVFVPVTELARVESNRNNLELHCRGTVYTIRSTLEAFEERLDPGDFVRINRSHLVRIDRIKELRPWFHGEYKVILLDGTELSWSRRYSAKRPDLLKST